jgi:hypothetical protein
MTTTLDSIPVAEKADFLKRLMVYGLDETSVLQPDLVVPQRTTMVLSTSPGSFLQPHILSTNNLDELKKWIGIPDRRFEKSSLKSTFKVPAQIPKKIKTNVKAQPGERNAPAESFASEDFNAIREATLAYIWGNSSLASKFKPIVEEAFGKFQVAIWPLLTITVKRGAVLELGGGANVLCVWKIVIEEGGQVRSTGTNLHVQSTIVQKIYVLLPPSAGAKVKKV